MAHYFSSDPPNILPGEGTSIGFKSIDKLVFCTTYASNFCYKILHPS